MERLWRHLRLGLAVSATVILVSGCELDTGGDDAGDSSPTDTGGNQDMGTDVPETCDCDENIGICNTSGFDRQNACACDEDCTGTSPCIAEGFCDGDCPVGVDPDCDTCACDRADGRCDAAERESRTACSCDQDCGAGDRACQSGDGYDEFCLARDSDGPWDCHYFDGVCEADGDNSTDVCDEDPDCGAGDQACSDDGHCDTFCDPDNGSPPPEFDCKDPDCDIEANGECD